MNVNPHIESEAEYIRVSQLLLRYRLVYLATPYTDYAAGLDAAARHAAQVAARLISDGVRVFAPIPHSHMIARGGGAVDPTDQALWLGQAAPLMAACDALCIARMPGWKVSVGVSHEIKAFSAANKTMHFLPVDWLIGEAGA